MACLLVDFVAFMSYGNHGLPLSLSARDVQSPVEMFLRVSSFASERVVI